MFNMCYVKLKQYSASFNTVINWLDMFWHLFQKYIIIFKISYCFLFVMYYIQKSITWSRKLNKSFSCIPFDIYFKN